MAETYLDEVTGDLPPSGSEPDLTAREWVRHGLSPFWSDCAGLSPELRSWNLQFGNLLIDSDGRLRRRRAPPSMALQLVVPNCERQGFIQRYHDSIFAGHLGNSRTVCWLLDRVYWPGLREDVSSYIASCSVCLAGKSPCPRRAPMGHFSVAIWTFWTCR